MTQKIFVLITGMHRSGTSFLARALNLGGVSLGPFESMISNDWIPLDDNPRGHWENKDLLDLGKLTLKNNGGSWDNIPSKINIDEKFGKKITNSVNQLVDTYFPVSGFKDPRIIFTLDSWGKYLPKNIVLIGIFRHPLKVAESLKIRDNFSYEKSIKLWLKYNVGLLKILKDYNGFLLDFDWPKNKLLEETKSILKKLGLVGNIDLTKWYTDKLFRSDKTFDSEFPLSKNVLNIYDQLQKKSEKNNEEKINFSGLIDNSELSYALLMEIQSQADYFKIIYTSEKKLVKEKLSEIKQLNNVLQDKTTEIKQLKDEQSSIKKFLIQEININE